MTNIIIPTSDRDIFESASQYFPSPMSEYIFYEKYSRWRDDLGRRETWPETVTRVMDYLKELSENRLSNDTYETLHYAILHMEVLPSMRLMSMAGDAARRSSITLYNCSALPVKDLQCFVEALIISMSGTGVGYSVEQQYISQLPIIKPQRPDVDLTLYLHTVEDSAEGWARALEIGLNMWWNGYDVSFNFDKVRPLGSILKIKGGRASGPEPLKQLLDFSRTTILKAQGRKLTSVECHDIMTKIASCVVSGSVRRSAMISLFSWEDQEMRESKKGDFWTRSPHRVYSNNSAVLTSHVSDSQLRSHFSEMVEMGNGEPGIFSRDAVVRMRPNRRESYTALTNPCAEIGLREFEFCNLTEVILRPTDRVPEILRKTAVATLLGTIQSLATNFSGLRREWLDNAEEERLLGVGFTGQMDCLTFQNPSVMMQAKAHAQMVNEHYARTFEIRPSVAITCVKPSGSTSILTDSSSGLHSRWSEFYVRRFRTLYAGPVARVLLQNFAPVTPENGEDWPDPNLVVVHFPARSPKGTRTRNERSALEQCEYWKLNKTALTEHNPSVTITYRPSEASAVEDWVVENREILGGMAFLPHHTEDVNLKQMPYEEISEATYHQLISEFPKINYGLLSEFEREDMTTSSTELACSSGVCDV